MAEEDTIDFNQVPGSTVPYLRALNVELVFPGNVSHWSFAPEFLDDDFLERIKLGHRVILENNPLVLVLSALQGLADIRGVEVSIDLHQDFVETSLTQVAHHVEHGHYFSGFGHYSPHSNVLSQLIGLEFSQSDSRFLAIWTGNDDHWEVLLEQVHYFLLLFALWVVLSLGAVQIPDHVGHSLLQEILLELLLFSERSGAGNVVEGVGDLEKHFLVPPGVFLDVLIQLLPLVPFILKELLKILQVNFQLFEFLVPYLLNGLLVLGESLLSLAPLSRIVVQEEGLEQLSLLIVFEGMHFGMQGFFSLHL